MPKVSKLLNKKCMTKNMDLSTIQQEPFHARKRAIMLCEDITDSIAPANPSKKDIDVKYSASYIFTCK